MSLCQMFSGFFDLATVLFIIDHCDTPNSTIHS